MKDIKPFQLEKWYFDFALPSGEVVFFFLAKTRILGWKDARLSLTATSPHGAPVHRSLVLAEYEGGAPPAGRPLIAGLREMTAVSGSEVRVLAEGGGLSIDVVFARHPEGRPAARPLVIRRGKRRIFWEPVQGRSIVKGTVRMAGRTFDADGCDGYIDRLESDVFPLLTPVETLYWGRLHHPEGSLVYAVIPRPRPYALLTWNSAAEKIEFDTVDAADLGSSASSVLNMDYPTAYTLTAEGRSASIRLDVENVVPAVETGFVAAEGIRSRFESRMIDFLGRSPRGIKFYSRGRATIRSDGRTRTLEAVPFFSEVVRFS